MVCSHESALACQARRRCIVRCCVSCFRPACFLVFSACLKVCHSAQFFVDASRCTGHTCKCKAKRRVVLGQCDDMLHLGQAARPRTASMFADIFYFCALRMFSQKVSEKCPNSLGSRWRRQSKSLWSRSRAWGAQI